MECGEPLLDELRKFRKVALVHVAEVRLTDVAVEPGELEPGLMGDVQSEVAEPHVVPISPVEDVLRGIEGMHSDTLVPVMREADLLQTGKPADWLSRVVFGRIKARQLQGGLPRPPLRIPEQVDDEAKLIDGFPLPSALAGEIHHPFEVGAEPVSSVAGFEPGEEPLHAQRMEVLPGGAPAVVPQVVREDRHP